MSCQSWFEHCLEYILSKPEDLNAGIELNLLVFNYKLHWLIEKKDIIVMKKSEYAVDLNI